MVLLTRSLATGKVQDDQRPDAHSAAVLWHAVSRAVIPRPDDWPAESHLTGYWHLPPTARSSTARPLWPLTGAGAAA